MIDSCLERNVMALLKPANLFPLIALFFAVVSAWRFAWFRRFDAAARTWLLIALIFAAISAWLNLKN